MATTTSTKNKRHFTKTKKWSKILSNPSRNSNDEMVALGHIAQLIIDYKGSITFCDIEIELRKQSHRIYLFAEDPSKSKSNKGFKPFGGATYLLGYSTKPIELAKLDFEEGCHDENANLERLKDCGGAVLPNTTTSNNNEESSLLNARVLLESYIPLGGEIVIKDKHTFDEIMMLVTSGDPEIKSKWNNSDLTVTYGQFSISPPIRKGK